MPQVGQVIAHKQDGTPLVRYSVSMPLASIAGDVEGLAHYAGQGLGLVNDILPVAEITGRLVREMELAFGSTARKYTHRQPNRCGIISLGPGSESRFGP